VLNTMQDLLEASLDMICVVNETGVISQISANCKNLLGFEPSEMIGKPYTAFMLADATARSYSEEPVEDKNKIIRKFENRGLRKDGTGIPLSGTAIWSPETKSFYAIVKDATERKMSAQQLEELNESLRKRAAELQASNTELERFAYVASHDLQEPLRMVSSFLQLLENKLGGDLDETGKKYIDFAIDGAERMKTLIQDLLQYSRVGTSKEMVVNVNMDEILNSVKMIYSLAITESSAELVIHPLPVIKAEKAQMHQLFQNLVGNAIKYSSPSPPRIEVGYEELPNDWQFYVRDQGIGIHPKFFEKIFVIFQRLHNKTEYSGTGIGLAICKKIVERHGGVIWVESEPGKGTCFFVRLPKY
ncbi:MAG: PAS domain-containing sensor histidine kinase, partial [Chitinophagaceae bacterium]